MNSVNVLRMSDNKLAEIRNSKIGFVFQSSNLLPKLTAIENVELPLIYRNIKGKERRERAREALDMVGLSDRMDHKPNQLSGGQQQRTAIARAVAGEPEIILADEPTGNLDSKSGKEIMNIFLELNKRRKTIVLISHDMTIAKYAQRILRISDGELSVESIE
jgi:putative ABC transport system ATP-binding protein